MFVDEKKGGRDRTHHRRLGLPLGGMFGDLGRFPISIPRKQLENPTAATVPKKSVSLQGCTPETCAQFCGYHQTRPLLTYLGGDSSQSFPPGGSCFTEAVPVLLWCRLDLRIGAGRCGAAHGRQ